MGQRWYQKASVQTALATGAFVLAAAYWANRPPEPSSAFVDLVQFRLDGQESFFEAYSPCDPEGHPGNPQYCWRPSQAWYLASWLLTVDIEERRRVADEYGRPPGYFDEAVPSGERTNDLSSDELSILKMPLETDPLQELLQPKIWPVFDVSVLNSGNGPTVLASARVEVADCGPVMGDGHEAAEASLLNVLHRYTLDVSDAADCEYEGSGSADLPLQPPLDLRPGAAARFQLQLTSREGTLTWYLMALSFNFANGNVVETKTFYVSF